MILQFAYPLLLLALVPLLIHVFWMGRRLASLGRARRVTVIILRILIIILLVGALAGMRLARQSKDLNVLFLVDASDSIPKGQRDFAKLFIQKAIGRMSGGIDRAGVLMFGADAAVEQGLTHQPEFNQPLSVIDKTRTNIGETIQLALASFTGAGQKRIVLLSDGNQNAGDAEDFVTPDSE